jgi:hypothetical protein
LYFELSIQYWPILVHAMKLRIFTSSLLTITLLTSPLLMAQQAVTILPRLANTLLDVTAPSTRVTGAPGTMQIVERTCRNALLSEAMRRRIVNTAVQEWAFFGFQVEDQRNTAPIGNARNPANARRRFGPLDPVEVARVADSVAGYWSAAPGSDWILQRQNDAWNSRGLASRWRDPWSAAFISWVMCESGLGDEARFKRAIAHHTYIDQAIMARDNKAPSAAYVAYDPGEQPIVPGDMLCSGLRPVYRTLQQRRTQLGVGARTHCDIVVQVNADAGQILTIGGNVRSSVRLKIFPAGDTGKANIALLPTARVIFAHLKLRTESIEADALRNSPTIQNIDCSMPTPPVFSLVSIELPSVSC